MPSQTLQQLALAQLKEKTVIAALSSVQQASRNLDSHPIYQTIIETLVDLAKGTDLNGLANTDQRTHAKLAQKLSQSYQDISNLSKDILQINETIAKLASDLDILRRTLLRLEQEVQKKATEQNAIIEEAERRAREFGHHQ